jgi:glucose/arabinose dehydrogenase
MSNLENAAIGRRSPAARRAVRGFGLAAAMLLAAACGGSQVTPVPSESGLTSIAPPATASPSTAPSPTSTPTLAPTPMPVRTPLAPVTVKLTSIASRLGSSIGLESAGDSRLFAIVQSGQIKILGGGVFLDIASKVSCCGERGLLGLAFHPKYASNGRFFVRYTNTAGNLVIAEFHVSSDPNKADPASEKILLTIPHPTYANHNGGRIKFGPDGFLYIGTGDGGSAGDPNNHGQSLSTLLGKMLRIDVDHTSGKLPYAIPAGNPFAGQAGKLGEIWSYGLRNPYSFSFDRSNGDLWIADVGQDRYEEVDVARAAGGGGRGLNFGWNVMEADHCYSPKSDCITDGLTLPITEYYHGASDSTGCAIIGGFVYRGAAHPELDGRYFFSDNCSGKIWDIAADGPANQTPQLLLSSGQNATGWGQDSAGELYLVTGNGGVYRLD